MNSKKKSKSKVFFYLLIHLQEIVNNEFHQNKKLNVQTTNNTLICLGVILMVLFIPALDYRGNYEAKFM